MASLLSFAKQKIQQVGNTVNNDVVQPLARDVAAPVQRAVTQHVVAPVVQQAQTTVKGIANSPAVHDFQALRNLIGGNLPAARQQFNTGNKIAGNSIQLAARNPAQLVTEDSGGIKDDAANLAPKLNPKIELSNAAKTPQQVSKDYFANKPKATADYQAHTMQEFGNSKPNVASADSAKFIVNGGTLEPSHSAAYHDAASTFAKDYYNKLLTDKTTKDKPVLITAGGAGAGKTTSLGALGNLDKYAAVNDTNLTNMKSATERIEPALASGRKVRVAYTYRDPVDAFTNGNIPRAARTGRVVPLAQHMETHLGSLQTIQQLADKYKDNPNVDIKVIDNSRGPGKAQVVSNGVDFLKNKSYNKNKLAKVLGNELEKAKSNGTVSPEAYGAYKEGLGPQSGGQSQPQRPGATATAASEIDKPMTPVGVIARDRVAALKTNTTAPQDIPLKTNAPKVVQNRLTTGAKAERQNLSPETVAQVSGEHAVRSTKQLQQGAIANADAQSLEKTISDAHEALAVPSGHIDDQTVAAVQQAIERADAAGRVQDAVGLHDALSEHLVKQGQSIQAASLLYRLSPQGLQYRALKMLKQGQAKVTPELTQQVKDATDKVKATDPGTNERAFAVQDLQKIVNNNVKQSKLNQAFTLWRTGLLTGPLTATKVGVSHALMNVAEKAKDVPAVALDHVIAPFSGVRSTALTGRGTITGAGEGLTAAKELLRHGHDTPGTSAWSGTYDELGHGATTYGNTPIGKATNFYTQKVGQVHAAIPKPFYRSAYENDLYKQADAAAATQGLKGTDKSDFVNQFVSKPSATADQQAHIAAQYATFQQPTFLGKAASAFQKTPGGRALAPFAHIASAILTDVKNYSPIGAAQTVFKAAKDSKTGWTPQIQKQLVEGIGRGITGTAVVALGAELFKQGKITTGYPTDKKEQALWKAQGKQENSILVDGKWRQTPALGPFGSLLASGALLESSKGTNAKGKSNAGAALTGALSNISSQSYLSGLTQGASALNNPTENAKSFVKLEAGSLVPVGVGQVAQATDSKQRIASSPLDSIKSKIPGARETLPQSQTAFGQPLNNPDKGITGVLDPTKPSNNVNDPVTNELQRLINTTGTAGVPVPLQVTKVSGLGANGKSVSIPLNAKQQQQFISLSGPLIKSALNHVIQSPGYAALSDDSKAAALTTAKTDAENLVKAQTFNQLNGGQIKLTGTQQAMAQGTPVNYVAKAQIAADKNTFAASGKNFQEVGNTVFQRDSAGNVTTTPKVQYDYSVNSATLTAQKNAGNVQAWMTTANNQLQNIASQLKDPSTTPLKALTLQNDASSIQTQMAKYSAYGGFTKGSSGSSSTAFKTAGFKTAKAPKAPKGIKVKKAAAFKAPAKHKIAVSKIPSIRSRKVA